MTLNFYHTLSLVFVIPLPVEIFGRIESREYEKNKGR